MIRGVLGLGVVGFVLRAGHMWIEKLEVPCGVELMFGPMRLTAWF